MRNHVLDNRDLKVVDHLREHLTEAEQFSIVSAYFSIYGYDLLADELARVENTRFLFGDPSSVDDLDPGQKDAKAFRLTEKGLVPNQTLLQKPLALKCAEWVKSNAVAIRSIRQSNFLHGKMYLTGRRWRRRQFQLHEEAASAAVTGRTSRSISPSPTTTSSPNFGSGSTISVDGRKSDLRRQATGVGRP